jgi:hypothetical protein
VTTTFDVASALYTDYPCTYGWTTHTEEWSDGRTSWACNLYTEIPTAASTALLFRSAVPPLPSNLEIAQEQVPNYVFEGSRSGLPPVTTAITVASNMTVVETAPTPFVRYQAYEITRGNNTETIQLDYVHVEPYLLDGIAHHETATGFIPNHFMDEVSQLGCEPGRLVAVVTVTFLVEVYYALDYDLGNHWEFTVSGWEPDENLGDYLATMETPPSVITDGGFYTTAQEQSPGPTTKPDVVSMPSSPTPGQVVGSLGTLPIVVGSSSAVIVGSQTLRPGDPATVGGTPIVLVPSATAIAVGGTYIPLPAHPTTGVQQTIGTLGELPVVVGPSAVVIVGTQTLQPGGAPIVLGSGTTVSLVSSATAIVFGATTSILQAHNPGPQPGTPPSNMRPQLIFDGSTFTALPTRVRVAESQDKDFDDSTEPHQQDEIDERSGPTFVISGQTLAPGGAPVTVLGSTLSLAPSGAYVVIDGSTTNLATPVAAAAVHVTPPPLRIGNGLFTALPGTGTTYQIGSEMLTPGGSVVVAGNTISLAVGATALVVNGVTISVPVQTEPTMTNPPLLTIGEKTFTAASGTGAKFVIAGQTLTPGGTITVDGTTIVLSPSATELVYGSSGRSTSTALFPATTTRASEGYSGGAQAALTSSQQGRALQLRSPITALVGAVGFVGWLLT